MPSADSKEKKIILEIFNSVLNKSKYKNFKNSNAFIQYDNKTENPRKFYTYDKKLEKLIYNP